MKKNKVRLSLKLDMSFPVKSINSDAIQRLAFLAIASFSCLALVLLQQVLTGAP